MGWLRERREIDQEFANRIWGGGRARVMAGLFAAFVVCLNWGAWIGAPGPIPGDGSGYTIAHGHGVYVATTPVVWLICWMAVVVAFATLPTIGVWTLRCAMTALPEGSATRGKKPAIWIFVPGLIAAVVGTVLSPLNFT